VPARNVNVSSTGDDAARAAYRANSVRPYLSEFLFEFYIHLIFSFDYFYTNLISPVIHVKKNFAERAFSLHPFEKNRKKI
jgi:hypothetical protein